jgi:hypothetical protein
MEIGAQQDLFPVADSLEDEVVRVGVDVVSDLWMFG